MPLPHAASRIKRVRRRRRRRRRRKQSRSLSLCRFSYASIWCNVVHKQTVELMSARASRPRSLPPATRASVSFPTDVYAELERIAAAKKVSLAWVVREAAERYVADQWPLLEARRFTEKHE